MNHYNGTMLSKIGITKIKKVDTAFEKLKEEMTVLVLQKSGDSPTPQMKEAFELLEDAADFIKSAVAERPVNQPKKKKG